MADERSRAHSRGGLIDKIRQSIMEHGTTGRIAASDGTPAAAAAIPFRDYMAFCLYDETYGYYTSGRQRVGKDGDFYTSASVGHVMGAVLANCIRRMSAAADLPVALFEWGAGTGRLAASLLQAWRDADAKQAETVHAFLVDGHPGHREEARQALEAAGFGGTAKVLPPEEAERLLVEAEQPILLANELLDAFPVRRIKRAGGQLWEIGTAWDERAERFCDALLPLCEDDLAELARTGLQPREGQEAEWCTDALAWLAEMTSRMTGGMLILIDYGDVQEELLGPHRMNGTLLGYANHRAYHDPYLDPGGQDLTAHVNFTAVREAAERLGWTCACYATQKQFLLDNGVLDLLQAHYDPNPFSETARQNRAVRQLLLSDGMSELFKVLILTR